MISNPSLSRVGGNLDYTQVIVINKQRADRIQDYSWFIFMVSLVLIFIGLFLFIFNQLVLITVSYLLIISAILSFLYIWVSMPIYKRRVTHEITISRDLFQNDHHMKKK